MATLVTTAGSSSANSLCTLAEADAYIAASLYSTTAWDALTDDEKTYCLILAARVLAGFEWIGWPVYEYQAMPWPRWLPTAEYFTADYTSFPAAIKQAQAYIAYDVIYRGLQSRSAPSDGVATEAIQRLSLFGDISISYATGEVPLSESSAWSEIIRHDHFEIDLLLEPYISAVAFTSGRTDETAPTLLDEVT